jgi:hypothetical protein
MADIAHQPTLVPVYERIEPTLVAASDLGQNLSILDSCRRPARRMLRFRQVHRVPHYSFFERAAPLYDNRAKKDSFSREYPWRGRQPQPNSFSRRAGG